MSLTAWSTDELILMMDALNYVPTEVWNEHPEYEYLMDMYCDEMHRRGMLTSYCDEHFSPVCSDSTPILNRTTPYRLTARETNQTQARETADQFKKYIEDLTQRAQTVKYWDW